MNKTINKNSVYYISAKNNNSLFDWENTSIEFLEDILVGTIFFVYKNPSSRINSIAYFQRHDVSIVLNKTLDKIFNNLNFPINTDKKIIKEQIFLLISTPLNNSVKNKIFKV